MHKNIFRIFHAKIFACAKIARESASERLLPNSEEWAVILKDSSELCSCQKSAESELFCGILRSRDTGGLVQYRYGRYAGQSRNVTEILLIQIKNTDMCE